MIDIFSKFDIFNKKFLIFIAGMVIIIVISLSFSSFDFKPQFNQQAITEARELEISLNNLSFTPINNSKINAQTTFKAYNPNQGTVLLENINYNIVLDNIRISSGDIGHKPEGFVDSQEGIYPLIGNYTEILKDEQTISKDNRIAQVWNKILDNNSTFQINGHYSYKQTSSFQGSGGDVDFELIYP